MPSWVDWVDGIVPKTFGVEFNSLGGKKQVSGTEINPVVFRVLQDFFGEFITILNGEGNTIVNHRSISHHSVLLSCLLRQPILKLD